MGKTLQELDFSIAHFGVNCVDAAEAQQCVTFFGALLGLPAQNDTPGAVFTGTQIEWMKENGRGTHGHIGVATSDLPAARAYLESRGLEFDESSAKFFPDGRILVLYLKQELAGFAVHLLQK